MNSPQRTLLGLLLGGWALAALATNAIAQNYPNNAAAPPDALRADWEQRAVQHARPWYQEPPRQGMQAQPYDPAGARRGNWATTRGVSMTNATEQVPLGTVQTTPVQTPGPQTPTAPGSVRVDHQGNVQLSPMPLEEGLESNGAPLPMNEYGQPGPGCCPQGGDAWCDESCPHCCFPGLDGLWLTNFALFHGVQAFKGPIDQGRNGNFGVHEGLNWGNPVGGLLGLEGQGQLAYQIGAEGVQSNFFGDQAAIAGILRPADRNQVFLTAGLFRRAQCCGLQWGVVFDLLHDQYYGVGDFKQIRAEISLVSGGCSEIGFWGTYSSEPANVAAILWRPDHLYNLFYRRSFSDGGEGRVWAGVTNFGDGLLGADLHVPLGTSLALENGIHYLLPRDGTGAGQLHESWNLTMQLVWYPGQSARCLQTSPYRPLQNVADNSVFFIDQR